jgi:hypothetical protein
VVRASGCSGVCDNGLWLWVLAFARTTPSLRAKRSNPSGRLWRHGLLRFARNDGVGSDSNFKQRRGCASAFSRRVASELFISFHPLNEEGAGKAGCWLHPWVPCNKKHGGRTTGSTGAFRLSLRDGVTVSFVLFPVTGLSCHRHPRQLLLLASLAPASGRQNHTTSPSADVAFVCRNTCVHRIPPQRS